MNAKKIFIADTGGAIMVVGIFMTLFLVGGLFFLLGIGNAMVFHDHMQEVADASAFTGAVVHARFMNMIVAINLIMLALVVIHLVLALIHLGTLIANAVLCLPPTCILPPVIAACVGSARVNDGAATVLSVYDSAMKIALLALSAVQYGLAFTAWIAAPIMSANVANYNSAGPGGPKVLGLSEGLSIPFLNGGRIGLPVKQEEPGFLCEKLINEFRVPGMGKLGRVIGFVASGIRTVFCSGTFDLVPHWEICFVPIPGPGLATNGSWWSEKNKGPKKMWTYTGSPVGNGSDWNSVYGASFPQYQENAQKTVAVGGMLGRGGGAPGTNDRSDPVYIAQAEFYYDCTKTWTDPKCEDQPSMDNAMYSLGWRARLVRFHLPSVIPAAGVLNRVLGLAIIH
jgi:hypothetical protein